MLRRRTKSSIAAVLLAFAIFGVAGLAGGAQYPKQRDLPHPYRLIANWLILPFGMNGGRWGEVIGAGIDSKGNIWVFHRCFNTIPDGAATCAGRTDPPILEFNQTGELLASFGKEMFVEPHGFTIDAQDNIWACDANGSEKILGTSTRGPNGAMRGEQCFKLSPTGKLLMTLGQAGIRGNGPVTFDGPAGIAVAPDGDIFVADGHGKNDRIVKFGKDGTFLKTWGHHGSGPGEFDNPHDISIGGSKGYVYVADRGNNRIQIFDQSGNFIAAWKQYGRPSAVYVGKDDTLYSTDSHSNSKINPGYTRGITIGNAIDGSLKAFIAESDLNQGIVADENGNLYVADVTSHELRKYSKNK